MKSPSPKRSPSYGFTLIELLVAMAVLSVVVLMITSLVNGVSSTTEGSHRRIDSDSGARVALDRLSLDLEKMLLRPDVNYAFYKNTNNDSLSFYATVQGYGTPSRSLAVIEYSIDSGYRLQRGARTVAAADWKTPVFIPAALQQLNRADIIVSDTSDSEARTTLTSDDYQVLGEEIIRLEIAFLVTDNLNGVRTTNTAPASIKDLRGIVVGIAALDERSRAMLTPAQIDLIASELADAPANGDFFSLWNDKVGRPITGLPDAAVKNLRIYQRHYFFQ
jgi:prepilin-type N-terminal cleavage/methylation domain-containing protein